MLIIKSLKVSARIHISSKKIASLYIINWLFYHASLSMFFWESFYLNSFVQKNGLFYLRVRFLAKIPDCNCFYNLIGSFKTLSLSYNYVIIFVFELERGHVFGFPDCKSCLKVSKFFKKDFQAIYVVKLLMMFRQVACFCCKQILIMVRQTKLLVFFVVDK